jgi:hypothetical protein
MNTNETINVVDSQVKVNLPTGKTVLIERKMTSEMIANEMASRITGKLIGWGDLYDPKTNRFLTEDELTAKGAVFVTVNFNKVLVIGKDTVKKGRMTKIPTPYIRKETKFQVIANIIWDSYINRRSEHGNFVASEKRANGVENYADCKAIGTTTAGNFTINGVAFKVLEATKYYNENGVEMDKDFITSEFLNSSSQESKLKEAEKHGIAVEFDPQYRTVRIDSCESVNAFGFSYKPIDNPLNS